MGYAASNGPWADFTPPNNEMGCCDLGSTSSQIIPRGKRRLEKDAMLGAPWCLSRLTGLPSGSTLTVAERDDALLPSGRLHSIGHSAADAGASHSSGCNESRHSEQEVNIVAQSMGEIMNPGSVVRDPDFPNAPEDWTREQALSAAHADGVTLTQDHWDVIKALQDYFGRHEKPNVRALHDALEEAFHSRGGLKQLYVLFPGGPVAQGCRFAGLQAPSGAVDKSFGSVQ
jgi:TusE/DsrC/DsvC family sulfur relay protein